MMSDAHDPPSKLYKYRRFDRHQLTEILLGDRLYAASPGSFNDPFDCFPYIQKTGTYKEAVTYLHERTPDLAQLLGKEGVKAKAREIARYGLDAIVSEDQHNAVWLNLVRKFGVLSLSANPLSVLLWSHYSDSHRGVCLEFDTDGLPLNASMPVQYSADRPAFRPLDPIRGEDLMERTLLRKADFWSYEQEWRYIRVAEGAGHVRFKPSRLTAIILGAAVSDVDHAWLATALTQRMLRTAVRRVAFDGTQYRLKLLD